MKIVICGGHLTPALSVIESFSKDDEVYYFGRKFALEGDSATSLEYKTITSKGIEFVDLKTGRLQRSITRHTLPSMGRVPQGFAKALYSLAKIKPDVVVGFGGYVSFPVCLAAKILKIPVVIHEQTMEAGASNIWLGKIADKVCISFDSSAKYFPKNKIILTGNPIRKAILDPKKKFGMSLSPPVIYITGGSLGSHAINLLVMESVSKLLDKASVIHQTGDASEFNDFDHLSEFREKLPVQKKERYIVSKFFSPEEIGEVLQITDLVIGRAGINTVSELIVLAKPAILIPLPISQKNEQLKNAMFLKRLGLGEVLEQKNLDSKVFFSAVENMINNLEKFNIKDKKEHYPRNAATQIVKVIYATAKNHN